MVGLDDIIEYTFPLRLLYVEDNEHARESMMNVLEEFFGDVIIACDGQEGLEGFENNKIDLIITDINMPRLNGLEMIKEIRKTDTDVPILILSAYNESSFFLDSIKLGVDGYLLKPIVISQFMEILKKVTQKLKYKQEAEKYIGLMVANGMTKGEAAKLSKLLEGPVYSDFTLPGGKVVRIADIPEGTDDKSYK